MALGSDPTAQQIANEFGNATRNSVNGSTNIANYDLKAMWERIFGSGTHDRKDFAGYGKPVVGTLSVTGETDSTISLQLTMSSYGGLQCSGVVYYREDGTTGSWLSQPFDNRSSGTMTGMVIGLDADTSYDIYVRVTNDFNDVGSDYKQSNQVTSSTDEPPESRPYNLSLGQIDFNTGRVELTWDNSTSNALEIQFERNGSVWDTQTKSGNTTSATSSPYSNGDEIRARARYTSGPDTGFSGWSSTVVIVIAN